MVKNRVSGQERVQKRMAPLLDLSQTVSYFQAPRPRTQYLLEKVGIIIPDHEK